MIEFFQCDGSNECEDGKRFFCFSFRKACDYDFPILMGASLAYTATVRQCTLLAALIAAATVLFLGSSVQAGIGKAHQLHAQALDVPSALQVAHKATKAKTPCKRHKARARHDCKVCVEYAIVAPASRTRANDVSPKFKLVVADTLADQLAQAAAQASARLILADSTSHLLRAASAGVIARTGRIRN